MTYEGLKSFQQAAVIYDFTQKFCHKYINKKSRTYEQMVQAARSGKQNIAEGSSNSREKPKSEVFLLAIASASLKELLEDYKDFLRQKKLEIWGQDNMQARQARALVYRLDKSDRSNKLYEKYLNEPSQAANIIICLINQTTYLIDQQIRAVKKQMETKGIGSETHNQKLKRITLERKKKNEEFDKKLKEIIEGKRKNLD